MKKTLFLLPLFLLLTSCPTVGVSHGYVTVIKTRDAINNVDYTREGPTSGSYCVYYTLSAVNDLSNITLTVNFLDEDKKLIEGNTKTCIDLPSGASQTTKFGYTFSTSFVLSYCQFVVNAVATYSDSVYK